MAPKSIPLNDSDLEDDGDRVGAETEAIYDALDLGVLLSTIHHPLPPGQHSVPIDQPAEVGACTRSGSWAGQWAFAIGGCPYEESLGYLNVTPWTWVWVKWDEAPENNVEFKDWLYCGAVDSDTRQEIMAGWLPRCILLPDCPSTTGILRVINVLLAQLRRAEARPEESVLPTASTVRLGSDA